MNLDEEQIERCDDCAQLNRVAFDDLDAARLVLQLDDQLVCEADEGPPITLHSLAHKTLDPSSQRPSETHCVDSSCARPELVGKRDSTSLRPWGESTAHSSSSTAVAGTARPEASLEAR